MQTMITAQFPAIMKFRVSKKMEPMIKILCQLPQQFKSYRIDHTEIEFTEGPFGYFFTQEVKNNDWLIGWLRFCIKKRTHLYPTTELPMMALYCPLQGNIPCRLAGYGKLLLSEKKYGFCYVPPGIPNSADFKKGNYEVMYFSFSGEFLAEFIEHNLRFKEIYHRQQQHAQKGEALPVFRLGAEEMEVLNRIQDCRLPWPVRKKFWQARITDLLVLYFMAMEKPDTVDEPLINDLEKKLQQAVTYIEKNFHQPITIPELCRQVNLSLSTFERSFKKQYKVSPKNYIKYYRMQQAAILLQETNQPVEAISHSVGITGVNYFSEVFKKHYHYSPLQYRKGGKFNTVKG